MSKNPFINALVASGYISLLVTAILNSPHFITGAMVLAWLLLGTVLY